MQFKIACVLIKAIQHITYFFLLFLRKMFITVRQLMVDMSGYWPSEWINGAK